LAIKQTVMASRKDQERELKKDVSHVCEELGLTHYEIGGSDGLCGEGLVGLRKR